MIFRTIFIRVCPKISNNRSRRCDRFGPNFVKIRAILAILRPFKIFRKISNSFFLISILAYTRRFQSNLLRIPITISNAENIHHSSLVLGVNMCSCSRRSTTSLWQNTNWLEHLTERIEPKSIRFRIVFKIFLTCFRIVFTPLRSHFCHRLHHYSFFPQQGPPTEPTEPIEPKGYRLKCTKAALQLIGIPSTLDTWYFLHFKLWMAVSLSLKQGFVQHESLPKCVSSYSSANSFR